MKYRMTRSGLTAWLLALAALMALPAFHKRSVAASTGTVTDQSGAVGCRGRQLKQQRRRPTPRIRRSARVRASTAFRICRWQLYHCGECQRLQVVHGGQRSCYGRRHLHACGEAECGCRGRDGGSFRIRSCAGYNHDDQTTDIPEITVQ